MNILVCVKRVPDTASKIKIGADGKTIDEAGVQFIMNPYDEFAIEEALLLKEKKVGKGEVTVLTMGGAEAATKMRDALAMGADKGIHVKDDAKRRDPYSVAKTLAKVVEGMNPRPDLILLGRQAVDDQSLTVGPMLATFLGLPCVTDIMKLEVQGGKLVVEREIEGGHEVVEVEPPAVLSANKGLNAPRYASLKGIMAAKKKPVQDMAVPFAEERTVIRKMEYPPERKGGRIVGNGPEAVPELVRLLKEEAKAL